MARIRTIKPELWSDEKISPLEFGPQLLFIGLLNFVDDMGRKAYSPQRISNEIFPGKNIPWQTVDMWARTLDESDLIRLYEVDGHKYLWMPGFGRHQVINRPGHSDIPAFVGDHRKCPCVNCKIQREEIEDKRFGKWNGKSVPAGTHGIRESVNHGISDSVNLGVLSESSLIPHAEWKGKELLHGKSREDIYTGDQSSENVETATPASNEKHPSSPSSAVEQIARMMLANLQITPNPNILEVLQRSIQVKARSRGCSLEAAAMHIAGGAALLKAENEPERWEDWFYDARYEYVPQGDARLQNRQLETRVICGTGRCSEGWEPVRVGDVIVARRCPECVKLWE